MQYIYGIEAKALDALRQSAKSVNHCVDRLCCGIGIFLLFGSPSAIPTTRAIVIR